MITSTANAQIKNLIQLQKKGKARREQDVFLAEGIKMVEEVPPDHLEKLYVSESFFNKKEYNLEGKPYEIVSEQVFAHISDTKTPQGILAVVKQFHYEREELLNKENSLFLVLEDIQDPGNLGTIVRTAEGAGVDGIFMSRDTVDIYNPKVIRSTMGSIYRMKYVTISDMDGLMSQLKANQVQTYAAHLKESKDYTAYPYQGKTAFLIGNEGNGLSNHLCNQADWYIRIPMEGKVESLNAAIAATLLVYEAYRQRRS